MSICRASTCVDKLLLIAIVLASFSTSAASLVPCPDCAHKVSPFALMCPNCGCKGERIENYVKELAAKPKPKIPDRIVRADFGQSTCDALPVRMEDGLFVVMPLEKVLDVETLEFSFASTNRTIGYSIPQVALNQPLIRFPITETNLLFAAANTNVCSTLAETNPIVLTAATGWQDIQPKALKNHGKLLLRIKAGEDVQLPPKANPYYKFLADKWSRKGE